MHHHQRVLGIKARIKTQTTCKNQTTMNSGIIYQAWTVTRTRDCSSRAAKKETQGSLWKIGLTNFKPQKCLQFSVENRAVTNFKPPKMSAISVENRAVTNFKPPKMSAIFCGK